MYGEREKLWMLCRLVPVVHNRVNMMELGPPGSGKSYVYNNISRHVWLTAAEISPAVLFLYFPQLPLIEPLTRVE